MNNMVPIHLDKVLPSGHLLRTHNVDLVRDLRAVSVQRQIVVVLAERVLDFPPDGRDAQDYVRAYHGPRDRDPVEGVPELEGQGEDVDPGYLADGDGVGDWEGGVDDAFGAGEDFVHGREVAHYEALVHAVGVEGAVGGDGVDVGGEVVEDFEREVAELLVVLVGALDLLARVGFEEFEAQVAADPFDFAVGGGCWGFGGVRGGAGEGGEVGDEGGEVVVVGVGFEAEAALEGDGEGVDQVQRRQFGEQVGFSFFGALGVAFFGVDPDVAG